MVLSRGKTPKLACLLPSIPDIDEDGVVKDQIFPQGFHIFNIPFCGESIFMALDSSDFMTCYNNYLNNVCR
jgi:hypothetical protein